MFSINIERHCYLCNCLNSNKSNICNGCLGLLHKISAPRCEKCGRLLISELKSCLICRDSQWHFDRHISLFQYKGVAKDLFYLYKFTNRREIASLYASLIQQQIEHFKEQYTIVPSPWSKSKRKQKGWNQVEEITTILGKRYNVLNCLQKERGIEQKKLDKEQRLSNMDKRIAANKKALTLKDQKIILIDDIYTTGATVNECSKILKMNGAMEVIALTIAQD